MLPVAVWDKLIGCLAVSTCIPLHSELQGKLIEISLVPVHTLIQTLFGMVDLCLRMYRYLQEVLQMIEWVVVTLAFNQSG